MKTLHKRLDSVENKIPESRPIVKLWLARGNDLFSGEGGDFTREEILKKYNGDEYHHIFIIPMKSEKEKLNENKQG